MRKCIWCLKDDSKVKFERKAHTIPESLGGFNICANVCDGCNSFFGSHSKDNIAIEVVLKEIFNISRFYIIKNQPTLSGKIGRFKSQFFDVDWNKHSMSRKLKYKLQRGFQEKLARQFRKGIYKIYLEERERELGDALDDRFDHMRQFCRYDLNDLPVYYRQPSLKALLLSFESFLKPELYFSPKSIELDEKFRVFELMLFGHHFTIPTSKISDLTINEYFKKESLSNNPFGIKFVNVDLVEKVDFTFKFIQ